MSGEEPKQLARQVEYYAQGFEFGDVGRGRLGVEDLGAQGQVFGILWLRVSKVASPRKGAESFGASAQYSWQAMAMCMLHGYIYC